MELTVRPMTLDDLSEVDRIVRLAFGTFLNLPDPMTMFGDAAVASTRCRAAPDAALVAELDGRIVGSNFVTHWGSFGFFGPLSIAPQLWNQGVAQKLLGPTVAMFEQWECAHTGLFTFSNSAKHVALYQKFGFWPRFLTAVLSKEIQPAPQHQPFLLYSELQPEQKSEALAACRETTDAVYHGLDVSCEITAVEAQRLGDTLVQFDGSRLKSFAVCHVGANTEAGSGNCYVKFGCVRAGPSAQADFQQLLASCEAFAAAHGASRLIAGVSLARDEAYRTMLGLRFRTDILGVAMHRPKAPGFSKPGVFILDDWR